MTWHCCLKGKAVQQKTPCLHSMDPFAVQSSGTLLEVGLLWMPWSGIAMETPAGWSIKEWHSDKVLISPAGWACWPISLAPVLREEGMTMASCGFFKTQNGDDINYMSEIMAWRPNKHNVKGLLHKSNQWMSKTLQGQIHAFIACTKKVWSIWSGICVTEKVLNWAIQNSKNCCSNSETDARWADLFLKGAVLIISESWGLIVTWPC